VIRARTVIKRFLMVVFMMFEWTWFVCF
jgi:hypothetical protein